jgi:multidrug efflux pump subunit AcrA (membrane-fusion protein)
MRRLHGCGPRCGGSTVVGDTLRRSGEGLRARGVRPAIALAGLLLAACNGQAPHDRPAPTVGVVTIEPQPVTITTELPGRTAPFEIADVRPQVGGIIQARLFTEGSIVRAGQVLYQIEPAPFQAAYDQARGQLASA